MQTAVTQSQMDRVVAEWSEIAGEPLKISATHISEPIYAFGSELACLRLYRKMLGKGRAAYSENMQSWYYVNR